MPPYPSRTATCSVSQQNTWNLPNGGVQINYISQNQALTILAEEKTGSTWYCFIQYVGASGNRRGWVPKSPVSAKGQASGITSEQK